MRRRIDVLKLLLSAGANVNLRRCGKLPIDVASSVPVLSLLFDQPDLDLSHSKLLHRLIAGTYVGCERDPVSSMATYDSAAEFVRKALAHRDAKQMIAQRNYSGNTVLEAIDSSLDMFAQRQNPLQVHVDHLKLTRELILRVVD